jgi:6,7-dimethyl-8-ribityllumazine synthase
MEQVQVFEGIFRAEGKRFGIVVSRFNSFITDRLLDGAIDALVRSGVSVKDIVVVKVPGAFELPGAVKKLSEQSVLHGIVVLGAIIQGQTNQNEYISNEVIKGVSQLSLASGIPITLGVMTPDTIEQAIERAGTKYGNKGFEAALAAVEMVDLYAKLAAKR